jgi:hypothetical protein
MSPAPPRVFLDPDGTAPIGLAVILHHATGVHYAHQCGGNVCEDRSAEGYLVPCPEVDFAADEPRAHVPSLLADFFLRSFANGGPAWTRPLMFELASIVAQVVFWNPVVVDAGTERTYLQLDTTRIAECVEGWVPVRTAAGDGVLVFPNSD